MYILTGRSNLPYRTFGSFPSCLFGNCVLQTCALHSHAVLSLLLTLLPQVQASSAANDACKV